MFLVGKKEVVKIKHLHLLIITLLALIFLIPLPVQATEAPINILINENLVVIPPDDQQPVVIDDRTYVPLRVISENLGYLVDYQDNSIFINSLENPRMKEIEKKPKNLAIYINNKFVDIPNDYGQAFISKKDRALIPLRIVAEELGCEVNWVPGVVIIEKRENDKTAIASKEEDDFNTYWDLDNPQTISIMGSSLATSGQLKAFLKDEEQRIKIKMFREGREFHPFPDVVDLYLRIGEEYGIRGDIALCQALKETGYFQFTGDVKYYQNNYCGLWATGAPLTGEENNNGVDTKKVCFIKGLHGLTFANPALGVEAHIQHLYAYACDKPLPRGKELLDPRFTYVKRGISPNWTDLNGKWAVPGIGYGESIIQDYYAKVFDY